MLDLLPVERRAWPDLQDALQCTRHVLEKLTRGDPDNLVPDSNDLSTNADEQEDEVMYLEMYRNHRPYFGGNATPDLSLDEFDRRGFTWVKAVRCHGSVGFQGVDLPELKMTEELNQIIGVDYDYRLLSLFEAGKPVLQEVGWCLLSPYLPFLNIDTKVGDTALRGWLYAVEKLYWKNNPFRNSCHAACVAHYGMCLLRDCSFQEWMTEFEWIAFVVTALVHNIGHSGRSSSFYINSNSVLALLTNDAAVMEECHATLTAFLFECVPEIDFCQRLSQAERKRIKKLVLPLLASTAADKHHEVLSLARVRQLAPDFDPAWNEDDRHLALTLMLKLADFHYYVMDWNQHKEWSLRRCEESYQQGDHEAFLNLPITPQCDRSQHKNFPHEQSQFLVNNLMVSWTHPPHTLHTPHTHISAVYSHTRWNGGLNTHLLYSH
eukprot:Blabericola_migrator_1__12056@NODE_741_length_6682_cov_71_114588_g531_i0_p1_GENE_NODE_741_length_6682_cov_71_114588_g531_i0NODE_741_length_6682_cov_71_114588_g531_i0_p1_ORF_typecomplete_len435_score67_43PDEase_I/PF00233_19/5_6e44_NODE_741_length_6682_cov_71_114588_g531_i053196623